MAEFVEEFSLIRTLKSVSAGTTSVGGDLERSTQPQSLAEL